MKKQTIKVFTCEKCLRQFTDEKACKEHEAGCECVEVRPELLHLDYRQRAVNREPELQTLLRHRSIRRTNIEYPEVDSDVNIEFSIIYNYGTISPGDALERAKNQVLEMLVEATKRISTLTSENIDLPQTSREEYDAPSESEDPSFVGVGEEGMGFVEEATMRPAGGD